MTHHPNRSMRPRTARHRATVARRALAVIDHEFASDLRVAAVARRLAVSERDLQRCLAEVVGTSFRRALIRRRMQEGERLLRESHLPVAAVAEAVGYRRPTQFAKAFRAEHGRSPSAFRIGLPARDGS